MGLNRKCQFSPFIHHITYKVGFWYFKILCNRNTVSNKTYQYFDNKRLVKPGSKYPNWQISQPISHKAKFLHRDNIYLVDLKSYITYQNIRVGAIVRPIFIPWNNWNVKKLPYNLHEWYIHNLSIALMLLISLKIRQHF